MEVLQTLSVALGLATLSGYSLYLTVFATGLSIHLGWVHLSPQFASLSVLGDPVILVVSGILFLLEFFADKIPWVDSVWDAIHTVIRPVGGALIAVASIGQAQPVFQGMAALAGALVATSTHAAKAGTRVVANTSPEPFSNWALSLAEDGFVITLGLLALSHPFAAVIVVLAAMAVIVFTIRWLVRWFRSPSRVRG